MWIGLKLLKIRYSGGLQKLGNEPVGFLKEWEISDQLDEYCFLNNGFAP
jgi:hypothetical protein